MRDEGSQNRPLSLSSLIPHPSSLTFHPPVDSPTSRRPVSSGDAGSPLIGVRSDGASPPRFRRKECTMTVFAFFSTRGCGMTLAGGLILSAAVLPSSARAAEGQKRVSLIVRCQDPQDPTLLRRIERLGGRHGRAWRCIRSV